MSTIKTYWREILIILLLVWALYGNFKDPTTMPQIEFKEIVVEKIVEVEIDKGFDSLTFHEAFSEMYTEHGEGYEFEWRGNNYLTKLKIGE